MKRILVGFLIVTGLALALAAGGLVQAHLALRERRSPLPEIGAVGPALEADVDLPVRLSWINSASQDMPRSAVLDPGTDPEPEAPYRMSHPAFVLEWADGRRLLIDTGMGPDLARDFGGPAETFAGASPIEPHAAVATVLARRAAPPSGVLLSHLHSDHVDGVKELCAGRVRPLPVFAGPAQMEHVNYTTRPGVAILEGAGCVERTALAGAGPLYAVPGVPGVRVIEAGGHTPGSQIVVAALGAGPGGARQRWAFTGDIVNALDGIRFDVPKPWLYSTLLVPEDGPRLSALRHWLRALHQDQGFGLLVPHDERAIDASGIGSWAGPGEGWTQPAPGR